MEDKHMKISPMSRRSFIQTAALATAGLAVNAAPKTPVVKVTPADWPIGCFNRPWMQAHGNKAQALTTPQPAEWGYDVALKGMNEAGYKITGLLTRMNDEPFIGTDATPEYLTALKRKIALAGLRPNMGALRVSGATLADQIKDVRQQIDNAKTLGLEFVLTFGVDKASEYENYYKAMANAADYAFEQGIKLVLKPHGGGSGASEEIIRCRARVNRPNFKVWYDAGNIVFYTGKDPLEQLKPIAKHVTGFCAKDCDKQKGKVMIQLGTGVVDFHAVFTELKNAGFNGPVMLECAAGTTYEEVTANAKANRLYLEKLFATL